MSEAKPKGIEVGPDIHIESCMTLEEYKKCWQKNRYKTWKLGIL